MRLLGWMEPAGCPNDFPRKNLRGASGRGSTTKAEREVVMQHNLSKVSRQALARACITHLKVCVVGDC